MFPFRYTPYLACVRPAALLSAVAIIFSATATAQSWTSQDQLYKTTFSGCSRLDAKTVTCSGSVTYIGTADSRASDIYHANFRTIDANGKEVAASWGSVANGSRVENRGWGMGFNAYKDLPVKVNMALPYSSNSIPRLVFNGYVLSNVRVGGTPSSASPTPGINLPPTQAFIGGKAFTISFTNCQPGGSGYACMS
jgi:hypothetical protein